jgi:hypothetical protein
MSTATLGATPLREDEATGSGSIDAVRYARCEQLHAEQTLEIMIMQGWQTSNGLEVTDAATAYHHLIMHHRRRDN